MTRCVESFESTGHRAAEADSRLFFCATVRLFRRRRGGHQDGGGPEGEQEARR